MLSKKYIIYTDGGCLSNPDGKGACSYVILSGDGKMTEKNSTKRKLQGIAANK